MLFRGSVWPKHGVLGFIPSNMYTRAPAYMMPWAFLGSQCTLDLYLKSVGAHMGVGDA